MKTQFDFKAALAKANKLSEAIFADKLLRAVQLSEDASLPLKSAIAEVFVNDLLLNKAVSLLTLTFDETVDWACNLAEERHQKSQALEPVNEGLRDMLKMGLIEKGNQ